MATSGYTSFNCRNFIFDPYEHPLYGFQIHIHIRSYYVSRHTKSMQPQDFPVAVNAVPLGAEPIIE